MSRESATTLARRAERLRAAIRRHDHLYYVLLGRREPYLIQLGDVIKGARDHRVMLEINAQPDRLDLNDVHVHAAREAGVLLVVSADAHRIQELDCMRYGIDQARPRWCEAKDVANTGRWRSSGRCWRSDARR